MGPKNDPEEGAAKRAAKRVLENAIKTREVTKLAIQHYSITHDKRWQIVMFLGLNRQEGNGIVDMLAIRKNTKNKNADMLEIILIDIKGSEEKAKKIEDNENPRIPVKEKDVPRLVEVKNIYHASNIVHAEYLKNGDGDYVLKFYELDSSWNPKDLMARWTPQKLEEIFK